MNSSLHRSFLIIALAVVALVRWQTDAWGDIPNTWSPTGSMSAARRHAGTTTLPDGRVLATGGVNTSGADFTASAFSNTAEIYDPVTGTWSAVSSFAGGRAMHTATRLRNGKVLIVGGWNGSAALTSAHLFDPTTGSFAATGSLATARYLHDAQLLDNGKVLIVGGFGNSGPLNNAELYDPNVGTFSAAANTMSQARYSLSANLLPSGKVLIAGGFGTGNAALSSAELFDPASGGNGSFSPTGSLLQKRGAHRALVLPNGTVFVSGGNSAPGALLSNEIYNPNTGTFSPAASFSQARQWHSSILMPNGKVLVTGGNNNLSGHWDIQTNYLNSAEIYDPVANTSAITGSMAVARSMMNRILLWTGKILIVAGGDQTTELFCPEMLGVPGAWSPTANNMITARQSFQSTALDSGKLLITGGTTNSTSTPTNTAELYDYITNTFSPTGNMTITRHQQRDILLSNGKVLVTGGRSAATSGTLNTAELYDPVTGTFSLTPTNMVTFRRLHRLTRLADNRILISGGLGGAATTSNGFLSSAQIYDPVTGLFSATGNMTTARSNHRTARLPDGRVLIVGGSNSTTSPNLALASAELFDPSGNGGIGSFTALAATMSVPRDGPSVFLLPSGKVMIVGGSDNLGASLATVEIFDPATSTFSPSGNMNVSRDNFRTVVLDNGKILISGGRTSTTATSVTASAELYDFVTGISQLTGSMTGARENFVAIGLPNGQTLAFGGINNGTVLGTAELYSTPICNTPPFCNNDSYSTTQNVALNVGGASGVLGNDSDLDGNPISAILVSAPAPAQGSVTLNSNGGFTFTPATNFTGDATFTYKATDGQADSNIATVTIRVNPAATPVADLAITQSASPNPGVDANGRITYTIGVTNNGPANATGVVVTDFLPAGVHLVSATSSQGPCTPTGGSVSCALGTINVGASPTVTVVVHPFNAGSKTNTASVAANETDSNNANNSLSLTTNVANALVADLRVNIAATPDPAVVFAPLTYQVTVSNLGEDNAPSATVQGVLPPQVSFVSVTSSKGSCSQTSGVVTCNMGAMAAGTDETIVITVTPQEAGTLTNTVTVAGDIPQAASLALNNSATATTPAIATVIPVVQVVQPQVLPPAQVNTAYTQVLPISRGEAISVTVVRGSLPPGMSIVVGTPPSPGAILVSARFRKTARAAAAPALSSIFLTGTPTQAGTFLFTILVNDQVGSILGRFKITVCPGIITQAVCDSALLEGEPNAPYNDNLRITGGSPPYAVSLLNGSLPAGLTLNPDGSITGTMAPGAAGTSSFTVLITDQTGAMFTRSFSIPRVAAMTIPPKLQDGKVGRRYSMRLKVNGGLSPVVWAANLPPGFTLDSINGIVSGRPTAVGNFVLTIQASDALKGSVTVPVTLNVAP